MVGAGEQYGKKKGRAAKRREMS